MPTQYKFIERATKLSSLTLGATAFGFLRELGIARFLGATRMTDSFLVAVSIPTLLYVLLFGCGLNVSVIPRLAILMKEDPETGTRHFSEFLSIAAILGFSGSALIWLFPRPLVLLFAPGLGSTAETLNFVRYLAPLFVLFVIAYSIGSFQCAQNRVPYWGLIGLSQNVIIVLVLFAFGHKLGVTSLIVGTLSGAVVALGIQFYSLRASGYRVRWMNPLRANSGRLIFLAMIPFSLTFGIGGDHGTNQVDVFLVRYFGSRLDGGTITLLSLCNKLTAVPVLLVGAAIGLAVMPEIVLSIGEGRKREALDKLTHALCFMLVIVCPVLVLFFDANSIIVRGLFARSALRPDQLQALSSLLVWYCAVIVGWSAVYILNSYLAALRRTRLLIAIGSSAVLFDALLMIVAVPRMGAKGIALGVAVTSIVYAIALSVPYILALESGQRQVVATRVGLIMFGAMTMHIVLVSVAAIRISWFSPSVNQPYLPAITALAIYLAWVVLNRRLLRLSEI